MTVELVRFAYTVKGTFGILFVDGDPICYTVERPWDDNKPNVSCVPEGTYPLRMRSSGVVKRSSAGAFEKGWEICEVPDRTYIMVHVANHMGHLQGCVGTGDQLGVVGNQFGVWNSRAAFAKFMQRLPDDTDHRISITFDGEADNENEVPTLN